MSRGKRSTGPRGFVTLEVSLRRDELRLLRQEAQRREMRVPELLVDAGLALLADERARTNGSPPDEGWWPGRYVVHAAGRELRLEPLSPVLG